MDRLNTNQGFALTNDRLSDGNSHHLTNNSNDRNANQNRLLQYIRSMPLLSILFSRSLPSGSLSNAANSSFIFKSIMIFHLIILISLIGLTTFAIYHYNIRFYKSQTRPSETLIVCWLLRAIWHTINSSWSLRFHCSNNRSQANLRLSHTFYNIASILWISLAVVFLGVSPREDLKTVSSRICYFLLWITIASYVVPMLAYTFICVLLYLTLFVVIYFRNGSIPLTSSSMPLNLLKKLKVERYRDVLKKIELLEDHIFPQKNGNQSNDSKIVADSDKSNTKDENPDSSKNDELRVKELDKKQSFELNKSNLSEGKKIIPSGGGPLGDCVNNDEMLNERLCSICILNINDDDKVFVLPCDMRHLFHKDCLKKWFKRSSDCPICRRNITEMLTKSNETPSNETKSNEVVRNSTDQFLIQVVIHPSNSQLNSFNLPSNVPQNNEPGFSGDDVSPSTQCSPTSENNSPQIVDSETFNDIIQKIVNNSVKRLDDRGESVQVGQVELDSEGSDFESLLDHLKTSESSESRILSDISPYSHLNLTPPPSEITSYDTPSGDVGMSRSDSKLPDQTQS